MDFYLVWPWKESKACILTYFFFFAGESACQFVQSLCSGSQFSLQHLNIGFVILLFLCVVKRKSLMILKGNCRIKKVFFFGKLIPYHLAYMTKTVLILECISMICYKIAKKNECLV